MTIKAKLCGFSVYEYPCERKSCWADETQTICSIREERERKENERAGENTRAYWIESASGAEK